MEVIDDSKEWPRLHTYTKERIKRKNIELKTTFALLKAMRQTNVMIL